jgi:hypothetical protein
VDELGLRAYAARDHIKWDRYWRETKPGEFATLLDTIGRDLEHAVPAIQKLIAKHEVEAEEARRRAEERHRRWEKVETIAGSGGASIAAAADEAVESRRGGLVLKTIETRPFLAIVPR